MPEANAAVFLDESSVVIRDEESCRDDHDTEKNAKDNSNSLSGAHLLKGRNSMATTDDNEEGKNASR